MRYTIGAYTLERSDTEPFVCPTRDIVDDGETMFEPQDLPACYHVENGDLINPDVASPEADGLAHAYVIWQCDFLDALAACLEYKYDPRPGWADDVRDGARRWLADHDLTFDIVTQPDDCNHGWNIYYNTYNFEYEDFCPIPPEIHLMGNREAHERLDRFGTDIYDDVLESKSEEWAELEENCETDCISTDVGWIEYTHAGDPAMAPDEIMDDWKSVMTGRLDRSVEQFRDFVTHDKHLGDLAPIITQDAHMTRHE